MAREVRCVNPSCGYPSRLGDDGLGRTFRCARCGTRLPVAGRSSPCRDELSRGPVRVARSDAPWEREEAAVGRSLGVALPSRLGRYRVQATLDPVDGATAYRAVDPGCPGEVTVVVPSARALAAAGSGGRQAFLHRAGELVRLRHRGIVPVLEAGSDGLTVYLAIAHLGGPTLADRLAEGGRFDPVRAAEAAAELAAALACAHERGVVHRDVSPARVRFGPGGLALLGGFLLDPPVGPSAVEATPAYIAPERLGPDPGPFLPASDQYSLGALLYEMICGRPPFDGPTARVLEEIRTDEPIPPRDWRPRLSRTLERICLKAMARDPGDRYLSCRELADELRRWLRRVRVASDAVGRVRGAAGWARRRPAAAVSAALAVVGLVATTTVIASALIASTSLAPYTSLAPTRQAGNRPALARTPDRP
jgi:hypothetical protein